CGMPPDDSVSPNSPRIPGAAVDPPSRRYLRPPQPCELRATLNATPEAVEEFLSVFRKHAHPSPEAELLLREALTNAVVHGCHANPALKIRCALRMKGPTLLIAVRDEGRAFDWHRMMT